DGCFPRLAEILDPDDDPLGAVGEVGLKRSDDLALLDLRELGSERFRQTVACCRSHTGGAVPLAELPREPLRIAAASQESRQAVRELLRARDVTFVDIRSDQDVARLAFGSADPLQLDQ